LQYFEVNIGRGEGGVKDHSNIYAYIHLKNVYYANEFFLKCQIKITKNLKSGLNCPVYIFGPVDIMVIDKTDSLVICRLDEILKHVSLNLLYVGWMRY